MSRFMRTQERLDETQSAAVQTALAGIIARWHASVGRQLLALGRERPLPPRLFLWGGSSELPEVLAAVEDLAGIVELPFERRPEVRTVEAEAVPDLVDRTGLSPGRAGVAVMALARWALKMREPPDAVQQLVQLWCWRIILNLQQDRWKC